MNGKILDLSTPQVMAVINVTPDSFFSGSRLTVDEQILYHIEKVLEEGASIIDIGAYSTRPNATYISDKEEINRLEPILKKIRKKFPGIILSVDTFRASVARAAVENYGVQIINDVSGGTLDDKMFETIADLGTAYVLMHMRGTPATMQNLTEYSNLTSEILHFFEERTAQLVQTGVKNVIIDPGFGFAKTLEQNYELLSKLNYFKEVGFPILAGISRKSMIYKLLDSTPEAALNGTTVLNTLALLNGANILRVHDVKEAVETIKIVQKYLSPL